MKSYEEMTTAERRSYTSQQHKAARQAKAESKKKTIEALEAILQDKHSTRQEKNNAVALLLIEKGGVRV